MIHVIRETSHYISIRKEGEKEEENAEKVIGKRKKGKNEEEENREKGKSKG